MKKTINEADTLSGDELIAITTLTDRRHRQLAKAGFFPSPINGRYKALATLRGLFTHFRKLAADHVDEFDQERLKKLKAERFLAEVAAEKEAGTIIDLEVALLCFSHVFTMVKTKFNGITHLARELEGKPWTVIQQRLDDETRKILNEGAAGMKEAEREISKKLNEWKERQKAKSNEEEKAEGE